ncbi:helix-turn-helix domain-containing protein [Streptomyces filamentosus]|uniref:helix-turn-helix domain-containing protein n=1 Tax=Streptomyces filamentosus TaxID=67294 RepID=UPI0037D1EE89
MHGTQSVEKAAKILRIISESGPLGVSEVGRRAGMPKTTAYRIIACLCSEGLLERTPSGYSATSLHGRSDATSELLRETAAPYLLEFYSATTLPTGIATQKSGAVQFLNVLYSPRQRDSARDFTAPSTPGAEAARLVLESFKYFSDGKIGDVPGPVALTIIQRRMARIEGPRNTGIAMPVMISRRRAVATVGVLVPAAHNQNSEHIEHLLRITSLNVTHALGESKLRRAKETSTRHRSERPVPRPPRAPERRPPSRRRPAGPRRHG